jgi:hypothetical protein
MERDVSDKPRHVRRERLRLPGGFPLGAVCRSLLAVDDLVGDLRAELRSQGRLANTIFVLTADNGMTFGEHRLLGDKRTPYSTHVPFLVSWPARLGTKPRTISERLQNIDLAPTVCAIAGCRMGPYPNGQRRPDGRSFARLLLGRANHLFRDAVYLNHLDAEVPIPRWHGVDTTHHSPLASRGCMQRETNECLWEYVRYETGERELYDLSNGPCWKWRPGEPGDPCRLENLAGRPRYASIQRALSARLQELKRE